MRNLRLLIVAAAFAAGQARASGVLLNPNRFHGTVSFGNTNPEILALFASEGMDLTVVGARSSDGQFTAGTGYISTTPTGQAYELFAESTGGVNYTLNATGWVYRRGPGATGDGQYYFAPVANQLLQPLAAQPGGVTVDFTETVGVVRFHFGTDATCATPVTVQSASLFTSVGFNEVQNPTDHFNYYVRGGTEVVATLNYITGTDPYLDTISHSAVVDMMPPADGFQDLCIAVPPTDATTLGRISTPYQVPGHATNTAPGAYATAGGPSVLRYSHVNAASDLSNPSTWPVFPNLLPGNYALQMIDSIDHGHAQAYYRTAPVGSIPVSAGATADGSSGGAYPLVMHPGYFNGSVLLHDRYVAQHPGAASSLTALSFSMDFPNAAGDAPLGPSSNTALYATDGRSDGSFSYVSFPGHFDPATGQLASSYSQPILHPYDQAIPYTQSALQLTFDSAEALYAGNWYDVYYYVPATVSPSYRLGTLNLSQAGATATVGPGAAATVDHDYCFNEIHLQYSATNGAFVNPSAHVTGGFDGADWRSAAAHYTGDGTFYGIPAVGIYNGAAQLSAAAASAGEVRFALPQGTWNISPSASFIGASGVASTGNFTPINGFTTGCGQRISLVPGLAVTLDPFPACAPSNTFQMTGTVQSADGEISRIWYTVNGGAAHDICSGVCAPAFSATVTLDNALDSIAVFASSPFDPNPASSSADLKQCNAPPVCTGATPSIATLWPPDHKFVPVSINGITDPDGDATQVTVTSVQQDEPTLGGGSGHTSPDAVVQGAAVQLRSERAGSNPAGRLYFIHFTASDGRGATCSGTNSVCVPHDQGGHSTCVDTGQRFNSY